MATQLKTRYWYVDLDAERVEDYLLECDQYRLPEIRVRGDALESPQIPGFAILVEDLLAEPGD
jgi:hypothetical protein